MLGGKRPGAGRPKGARSKSTIALEAACKNAALGLSDGFNSLMLFQSVYRNDTLSIETRLAAAAKALPYEHPSLASVEFIPGGENMMDQRIKQARGTVASRLARLRPAEG